MKLSKILTIIAAAVLLIAGAVYYALVSGAFDLPMSTLEAKYKLPNSQFMEIDGIHVHYVEDGAKDLPTLVLLHASYLNLRAWDQLAKDLSPQFHIVRMDLLTAGLTGPDPKEDYSTERNMLIVDELTKQLGVEKFNLLGTSSGGTVAFRYAAAHPERVLRLILINCAGMPRTVFNDPNRARGTTFDQWFQSHLKTRGYWAANLGQNFGTVPPSPELIDMVYDMNRREDLALGARLMLKNYHTGGPEETLAKITAPTMIMWGMANPTVMHLEADVFELWLSNAPSLVKKYPRVGHYFYLEIPRETAKDIGDFLSGGMDANLRVTQRMSAAAFSAAASH